MSEGKIADKVVKAIHGWVSQSLIFQLCDLIFSLAVLLWRIVGACWWHLCMIQYKQRCSNTDDDCRIIQERVDDLEYWCSRNGMMFTNKDYIETIFLFGTRSLTWGNNWEESIITVVFKTTIHLDVTQEKLIKQ